jgi:hypothetical protein
LSGKVSTGRTHPVTNSSRTGRIVGIGSLVAVLVAAIGASSGSAAIAARASAAALQFPAQTPPWLVEAETRTANRLGDLDASVVSVTLGRFPTVVLKGKFVCNACSHGPRGAPAPTGAYAATRFDGVRHQSISSSSPSRGKRSSQPSNQPATTHRSGGPNSTPHLAQGGAFRRDVGCGSGMRVRVQPRSPRCASLGSKRRRGSRADPLD